MDKNQGYSILKAVMLESGRGFALGHHPTAPSPYVTWACYDDEKGQRQYEWGHYGNDLNAMEKDFADRVQDYQRLFKVKVVQVEAPGLYKYYSTQRPVDIGTFPKPPHNAPDEIVNYDQRVPVEGGAFLAWGHLTYTKPLTEKLAADYELRPAPVISELRRESGGRPRPIAEQLRAAQREAQEQRARTHPKRKPLTGATDRRMIMGKKHEQDFADLEVKRLCGVFGTPIPALPPERDKALDKVKEPPRTSRSLEREER